MDSSLYANHVKKAVNYLLDYVELYQPISHAVILGTGLSRFEGILIDKKSFPYVDIPYFPTSTVSSHLGKVIFGKLGKKNILCFSGRFHWYEGYTMKEITFPIRVIQELGISKLIISNAAGGTNPSFDQGDIVFIKDHINLLPDNPLRGSNVESWGLRFPDMSEAYAHRALEIAEKTCQESGLSFKSGVYVGLPGPSLETPAEYRFIHLIGGDLVGMSTVPEVIVANHASMDVLGISLVTNACYPLERIKETTLEDVIAVAREKTPIFIHLVKKIIQRWT